MRLGSAQPETKGGTEDGHPHPIPHRQQERPAGLVWEVGGPGAWERATPFPLVLSAWVLQESLRCDPSGSGAPREEGGLPALLATGQTLRRPGSQLWA